MKGWFKAAAVGFISTTLVLGVSALGAESIGSGDDGVKFIQRFDKDGDGKVSREEFPGPQDHFTELDADGDGFIVQAEAPKGPPDRSRKPMNFISRFDKDGDGKVSREEFPGPQDHFTELDIDGDGFIVQAEAPKGPPDHSRKSMNFISRFDKDGDGKVSREEFPGPQDHFVKLDKNGDGFLDPSETPKGPPPREDMPPPPEDMEVAE